MINSMLHRNRNLSRNFDWKHFWSQNKQNFCRSKKSTGWQSMKKTRRKRKRWLFGKRIEKCKKKRRKMKTCGLNRFFIQDWRLFLQWSEHGFWKILENRHILFDDQKTFILEFKGKRNNIKRNVRRWNQNRLWTKGNNMVTCNRSLKNWFQKENRLICKFTITKHGK